MTPLTASPRSGADRLGRRPNFLSIRPEGPQLIDPAPEGQLGMSRRNLQHPVALATLSPRAGAPVLMRPHPVATARSAIKVSGVSPERWDMNCP